MSGPALPLALLVDPLRVVGLFDEGAPVGGEGGQPGVGAWFGPLVGLVEARTGVGGATPTRLARMLAKPLRGGRSIW